MNATRPRSRVRRLAAAMVAASLTVACDGSGPAGVDGAPDAALQLVARAESPARLPSALRPSTLLVEIRNTSGSLVRDTTMQVEPGQELELEIPVTSTTENQSFEVQLFLRSGDAVEVYRSDPTPAIASDPDDVTEPTEVVLLYTGPGSGADRLEIVPGESSVLLGATTTLEARAFSAGDQDQGTIPVEWASLDPGVLEVANPASGLLQAGDRRGVARVTAELDPMGFADTARVFVNPPAGDLRRAGGDRQDGEAGGRLDNPIRVRVLGTDGLPLGGQEVAFEAGSGGEVSPEVAVTGSDGRAEVEWTLGPQLGDQELVARVVADASLTVTFRADASAAALASLTVFPDEVTFDAISQALQLEVTGVDIFGNPVEPSDVEWTSSDPSVAGVKSNGFVTAAGNGETEVRASASGVSSAPTRVIVEQVPREARIEPSDGWSVELGEALTFQAVALDRQDEVVEDASFEWSSSDPDVLAVDDDGRGVGREPGEVTVTATLVGAASISTTSSGSVGPAGLHELVVTPNEVVFDAISATAELSVEGRDRFGNPVPVEGLSWTSSDPDVVSVSDDGRLTATGGGTAQVRASADGVTSSPVEVTVEQVAVGLNVRPISGWIVFEGQEIDFDATAFDRLGHVVEDAEFAWSTSSPSIMTVDGDGGEALARNPGVVTIRARLVGDSSVNGSSTGVVLSR